MAYPNPFLLTIVQGKRFLKVFRWPLETKSYKPISAMPQKTPVRFTVNGHGVPDGWTVKPTGIKGPSQLNDRLIAATVIDVNTLEFNALNAGDMPDYVSGGFIEFQQPVDLTDYTGRVVLKAAVTDAAPVLELSSANGRLAIDVANSKITFDVAAADTAALTALSGTWDWEMTKAGVIVSPLGEIDRPPWKLVRELVT